ncbi:NUDIX hydrolase [Methanothermobacter tenebrarum]|uniref:NUDIX hydrolase n=1 Tax=Methanothermobacter tenebrarum TaxID=680118 RepID=A0A328PEL9_9EURY|nr:NUDIX hydrolase [Methanothermobacter tenebrarum]MBC7100629.1 NUDIX hydrolase [Methanobacteriales archaeon]MBC7118116.1 NUDIX hydrolase [Methanobacteriaceae archaeon]NPV65312.1 NUDIX hydrolase [Methanobacteriaceae archaeon]RAO79711.1 NUDIX hydrolase [Methanothermobacter tenebrarum]
MEIYKNPLLTVDIVIICPDDNIILIKRKKNPYKGFWAIPGGFVEYGEKVEEAALREAYEETGLKVELDHLLGVYSDPDRDPRGHVISICFIAHQIGGKLKADTDASEVSKFKWEELKKIKLAFDHAIILRDAYNFIKNYKK